MRFHITPATVECPHHQVLPLITKSLYFTCFSIKERKRVQYTSPFISIKLFKSQTCLDKCDSRVIMLKRSCSASLDEEFAEYHAEGGLAQSWDLSDDEGSYDYLMNKGSCVLSETKSFTGKDRPRLFSKNSSWHSQVDLLEPKMLGIRPEPPNWPERESVLWADVEQKAKSCDLPVSLKMIQKRHQREGGIKLMGELAYCSMTKAFSSIVSIIVEIQSYALQMREALCDKDLELIISRVQRDMHSSFVWLFRQVFSRTPLLMVNMMILLANFSVYSTSHNFTTVQVSLLGSLLETSEEIESPTSPDNSGRVIGVDLEASKTDSEFGDSSYLAKLSKHINVNPQEILQIGDQNFRNVTEVSLWNSFLDEATKMQAGPNELVLDHDVVRQFVSPISVVLEPDNYMEFLRTDLIYQMGLSQDPNNPLLLCNYAQFLQLVAHDYDRAEECFKRAIQVEPPDAESLSRYAEFLWIFRKDLQRAEDAYLQALSIEPENSYYGSKYASFLWNTGGEETCFPLDAPNVNSRSSNL